MDLKPEGLDLRLFPFTWPLCKSEQASVLCSLISPGVKRKMQILALSTSRDCGENHMG